MGKKKVKSTHYYELLGIETDATPEQIKKAYRKKALQLHPDKRGNTKEAQDEFTQMKQAYDVLSDPQKKEVYDQAGEDGIKLMENYGDMSSDEMMATLFRSFGAFGTKGKVVLISVVTLLFSFFLIIPIFWCLRVDETVSWSWITVFTPLWILDGIYFCCLGGYSLASDASAGVDPDDRGLARKMQFYKLYRFLKQLLLLTLQIFVAMKLNGDVSWSVREVFIPYFVFDALSFIETIASASVRYQALTKESEGAGVSTTEAIKQQRTRLVGTSLLQLLLIAARLTQGALLALKIDGKLGDASWWLVFLPIWLYLLHFVSLPIQRYMRVRTKAKNAKPQEPAQPTHDAYTRESVHDENGDDTGSKYPLLDVFCSIGCIAIVASPYFILTARLQDASFSAFYVLLPWFIIAGLVLCFICCAISCIGVGVDEDVEGEVRSPTGDEGADLTTEYVAVEVKEEGTG